MSTTDFNNALDINGLNDLRRSAATGSTTANRKVAQQFEGMFLSMVLKGMRDGLPHSDPLSSNQAQMATSLYDNQIAQNLASGKGTGLADALVRQMERNKGGAVAPGTGETPISMKTLEQASLPLRAINQAGMPLKMYRSMQHAYPVANLAPMQSFPQGGAAPTAPTAKSSAPGQPSAVHVEFVDKYKEAAQAASQASGVPTKVILGQAALESGWGKHEVRDSQGNGSHNLFGIKAGADWSGPTVSATTTEYVNGIAQKVVQKFRAYSSYADSFLDYAKMVANSPRYATAMQVAHDALSFASAMGRSGYATDPSYGQKLVQVISGPLKNLV